MGRPTKFTEETRKLILQAVLNGLNKEEAAQYAGISYDTLNNWEKRATEEGKGEFFQFFEEVKKARVQLHADCLATIHRARRGGERLEETREVVKNGKVIEKVTTTRVLKPQWQAAAWILERDNPDRWGRRPSSEVVVVNSSGSTADDTGGVTLAELEGMSDSDLIQIEIQARKAEREKADVEAKK